MIYSDQRIDNDCPVTRTERKLHKEQSIQGYLGSLQIGEIQQLKNLAMVPVVSDYDDGLGYITFSSVKSGLQGGRFASESVAGFDRNQWPLSIGIGGRLASEYAQSSR